MSDLPRVRRSAFFVLLAAALLMFTGCGTTATDATSDATAGAGDAVNANSFVGTWALPAGAECDSAVTSYEFASDGTYIETTSMGTLTGEYTFENESLNATVSAGPEVIDYELGWEFSADGDELTLTVLPLGSPCTYAKSDV